MIQWLGKNTNPKVPTVFYKLFLHKFGKFFPASETYKLMKEMGWVFERTQAKQSSQSSQQSAMGPGFGSNRTEPLNHGLTVYRFKDK